MKELLRNKNAIMLWFSRTFSRFGDAFESLAFMYLIYDLTGSALAMGTIMIFSVIPNVIVSPIAGVLGDRCNKKRIMFVAEMARAIAIIALPILHHLELLQMWHIYVIAVVVSVAESFFEPCAQVVMVSAVTKEQLPIFNSAVTSSNQIAKLVGYALAGIVMNILTMDVLFLIDAITFLCSAIVVLFVSVPAFNLHQMEQQDEQESIWDSLKGGIQFLWKEKKILWLIVAIALDGMLLVPISQFLPQISKEIFSQSEILSGYVLTVISVGTIVGSILYPILLKIHLKLRQLLLYGNILIGLLIIGSTCFGNVAIGMLLYISAGIIISVVNIWCSTELQSKCQMEYMARVASLFSVLMVITDPLSATLSGWGIDLLSIKLVFMITAILFIGLGCILYICFWRFDKKENVLGESSISENMTQ